MLFGISERENSDPLPSKGRAEGIPVTVQGHDTFQQHHLQGSARIPDRLFLPSHHSEKQLLLPASSHHISHLMWAKQRLQSSFSLRSLPCLAHQSTGMSCQHKSRARRGGSKGISWWHCNQNQPHLLQLPLETGEKNRFLQRRLRTQTPPIL